MTDASETVQRFQNGLEPYIKPREQVNYIRRILALHLGSFSHDGPVKEPLALTATFHDDLSPPTEIKGAQREYIEALKANVAARHQFENVLQTGTSHGRPSTPRSDTENIDFLDQQLVILKLAQKRKKLLVIQKYLDELMDQPAASKNFLDTDIIFDGEAALPSVPKEVVNTLVTEKSTSSPDFKGQASQLEKTVLRAKLLLKHEERLLLEAKARSKSRPDVLSNAAKLEALNATRNELITWIETELSRAATEGPDETSGHGQSGVDPATITAGLAEIKQKYSRYLTSRHEILGLTSHQALSSLAPDLKAPTSSQITEAAPPPVNYLLTPYIERLLCLSRSQRAHISHKSHLNTSLGNQTKDSCQVLGHLAEESQLLPAFPMKDSLRRRSGLWDEVALKNSDAPDLSNRIKPWIFAADSAKIANLESVAETIEGGQLALENSINALHGIERLLGLHEVEDNEVYEDEPTEEDVWFGAIRGKDKGARKHSEKKKPQQKRGDPWSSLHGDLGLIGHED